MNKKTFFVLLLGLFLPLTTFSAFVAPPNNLNVLISPNGDVPQVMVPCTPGSNFMLLLTHRDANVVFNSFGPVERKYCGEDSKVTFSGFNITNPYRNPGSEIIWNFVRTPLEYIIKDTTTLGGCYSVENCYVLNLSNASNGYNNSVYLASSTEYQTMGAGPVFETSDNHVTWFNLSNGDGSFNISSTSTEVATGTSVMFFPGVMGSRLYDDMGGVEIEDWASVQDSNHTKLALDQNGKSINDIYTKDDTQSLSDEQETGITDEIYGQNIYNSFISDLKEWKDTEHIIKDYAFIPYDWRLSLEDIITRGATTTTGRLAYDNNQDFSESYILRKLNELGEKSANITLLGHSNGGLVIKALIQKLKDTNNPLYYKIDKIIFVAVPQVGTPDAVVNLLHGTDLGWHGFVMTNQRSRQLSENFPMAYNLLPSMSYFGMIDPGAAGNKLVSFSTFKDSYSDQISKYGFYVSNPIELKDYILGGDGRVKPAFSDTDSPSIGNASLYTQAEAVHEVLDNWQPASTTKVIQIAGWGEETLSGIDETTCLDNSVQGYHKCIKPRKVVDGDGTVVAPSALWMSTSTPNVERWWVNLKQNNTLVTKKRIHKDILEVSKLVNLIKTKVENTIFIDNTRIVVDDTSTLSSGDARLHYILHSPLTLGVLDSQGRYAGLDPITKQVIEEIPDVRYEIIGDTQFISVPSDLVGQVKLSGYAEGIFALDIEKQIGNTIIESTSFQAIPSSTTTQVTLNIASSVASSSMSIDSNGDGQVDAALQAKLGSVVTLPKYKWQGFLQPINDTAFYPDQKLSVFKGVSTVPVKFQLKDSLGKIVQASTSPIWLAPQKGSSMLATIDESIYSVVATNGSNFKWDPVSQQYTYNWSTKGLMTGYWYKIGIKLDDNNVYSVVIGLR
ncbi:MAG: PxKF domain-containing protein [Minisyncoccia bacterium]